MEVGLGGGGCFRESDWCVTDYSATERTPKRWEKHPAIHEIKGLQKRGETSGAAGSPITLTHDTSNMPCAYNNMYMWLDSRPRSYSTMSPASICRLRSSSIAACMRLRGSRSGTGHATPPSASHVDSSSLCVGYWGESTTCILGHAPALLGDLRRRYELLWEEVDQPLRAGEGGQPLRTGEFPTRANLTAERRAFSLAAVVAGESTRRSGACRHLWQSVSLSAIVSRSCREKRGRAERGACARRSRSRCLAVARDGR